MAVADVPSVDVSLLAEYYKSKNAVPNPLVYLESGMREQLCDLLGVSGVSGGAEYFTGGTCVGGYDALQDYGNSMFSKAKETLIRNIADDVFSALKSSGVKNAKTAPIGDVVASLAKLLPPRAHGARKFDKNFNKSSESQRKVCHALANSLNRHYGGSIIDMSASETDMCNKVAEVMYSLFTGLHTEFMTVAGDVMRVMNNMQTVMNYIKAAYGKQKELIESTSDVALREQSANTDSVYNQIVAEYERQMAILANLINVTVGPTGKSLIASLEENRDFAGLVKDIKAQVGTAAFGDKLAFLLAGVSSVAHSAELVDKALKKIGMSVQEFKSAKNASDLRLKVMNSMMKGHPSSKQLDDMVRAAQIIYNNNYDHDAISKALSKSGKGENDPDSDNEVQGGADEYDELPAYWAKKSLSKKIDNKKKYRDLVLKDFRKLLKSHYQVIMDAANSIAHHIGESIPLNDDLDHFVRVFANLPTLDEENLHVALSGYPKDSLSREKREKFFNDYEIVINTLEPLSKGSQGATFKALQSALRGMLKSIDDFSDKMVKALTEIHVDSPDEIAASLRKTSSLFYGSAESDSFGSGSWVAFDKVKMELTYFYSIANIKTNIARSADDLKSYASDYEQILGEEAGWLINHIRAEFKLLLELSDITAGARVGLATDVEALAGAAAVARANRVWAALHTLHGANAANAAVAHKNLKALWERQMNAKVNMVKVAQAVDLYLKSFTDGISRNPDSVQSVVKMLDQVELVAKWFNDKSGDNLATLFDVFPCGANVATVGTDEVVVGDFMDSKDSVVTADGQIKGLPDNHYYHLVEEKCAAGAKMPGNPFMGRPLSGDFTTEKQLGGILMLSERVVKSMRALENILSAFSSVGSKFGDLDPAAHTFMNPGQIFKAMCDYLTASTFASDFDPTDANRTAVVYRGKVSQQQTGNAAGINVDIPSQHQTQFRDVIVAGALVAANDVALAANNTLNGGTPAVAPTSAGEYGILAGVAATHNNVGAVSRKNTSLAMAAIPSDTNDALLAGNYWNYHSISKRENPRLDAAGWRDECYDTDFLFLMTVKSIVAKVFTVVDAYRLFHRPTTGFGSHYSLNPLRTILGGDEDEDVVEGGALNKVHVIPEALELYLRLPLLAEWYREKFNFNKIDTTGDENAWKLSLVPSIDGVWSGFVNLMFDKADFVTEGNYTETQAQALISEMNQIWKLYKNKYPKATVRQIINAFILEMNRIFGFVKAKEIKKYLEQRRDYLKGNNSESKEDFLDYDILNANDQFGSRPAPSDKFVSVSMKAVARKERESVALLKTIDELRRKMDADFISVTSDSGNATFTFIDTLRNYKNEMANAKNDTEEYQVVLRMMQGASKAVKLGTEKLIMVHEMIAAPLATLYATYKVIARYNALLHGCSLPNLIKWNEVRVNGHPTIGDVGEARAQILNNTDVLRFYKDFLNKVAYRDRSSQVNGRDAVHLALFGRMLTGNNVTGLLAADNCGYVLAGVGAPAANAALVVDNLNAVALCQDLLAAILDLCSNPNKLVTCSVGASGHINVDVGALEDLCKSTLVQIKENAKKLRQMFPPTHTDLVDKYEDRNTVGSTRWLEENLIKVIFEDRDKCGLPRGHTEHLLPTLNHLFRSGTATAGAISADSLFGSMDSALQGLVYYTQTDGVISLSNTVARNDFVTFPFSVIPMKKPADSQAEKNVIAASAGIVAYPAPAGGESEGAVYLNNLTFAPLICFEPLNKSRLNTWRLRMGDNKSLMLAFNNILRMYLHTNCEDGTNKFYAPLIESFAYGAASLEVAQSKAFPDVRSMDETAINNSRNPNDAVNAPTGAAAPALGAPESETVVFASNALAIRGLLTTVQQIGTSQKKKFTFETFAEIPEHLKERMRVNLPFFSKMLQNLADRAALLKNIVNNTALSKNVNHIAVGADVVGRVAAVSSALNIAAKTSEESATYYNSMLGKLNNLALDLKKCADNVYKELQDKVPYFLETGKDFLVDYRQRVGGMPVMPASSILVPLRCLERESVSWTVSDESHVMVPVKENGSAAYRFNYATRLLLARNDIDVQLDHMPGAKELYNAYATSASKTVVLSPQEYAESIKNMVKLLKFLADGAVYGRLYDLPARNLNVHPGNALYATRNVFGAVGWEQEIEVLRRANDAVVSGRAWRAQVLAMDDDEIAQIDRTAPGNAARDAAILAAWNLRNGSHTALVKNNLAGGDAAVARFKNNLSCLALQANNNNAMLSGLLELTENTNVRSSKDRLGESLGADVSGNQNNDRKRLAVQNILEYNVVPINVHAFMREVPFVNLLNYSYTFDRMVHDFVLPTYVARSRNAGINADNLMISASAPVASTRELMVKLLVHPYANLGNEGLQYFALLASLFNGNDDLKLGRPRYLSDQLWHKVLLTSSAQLVAGQDMFNDTGNNYSANLRSLEAGPAAYEAMRAVVRYGAPNTDRSQSLHNISQGLATGSRLLTEMVNGIRPAAAPAVALYLNNLGDPRPAALAAAYNDFNDAAINRALDVATPFAGAGLALTAEETLIPEAVAIRTALVACAVVHHRGVANAARNYEAQDVITRAIGGVNGTTRMWRLMYPAGVYANIGNATAAAATANAMINLGANVLGVRYDIVFQRLNTGAGAGALLPALKTRYNTAVNAMRDVTVSMAGARGAGAGAGAGLNNLIIDLEAKQSGADAFATLPAPFNARPVVVNNARLVGTYHNLAFFVDSFPNHTDNTRNAMKMVLGLALHGDTNAQVLAALNSVIASNAYRSMDFFDQAFIQIMQMNAAGAAAAAGAGAGAAGGAGAGAGAAGAAAELVLVSFCQHASSGLREIAELVDIVRDKSGNAGNMSASRRVASSYFMLPADPVATRGLKVMRPNSNGVWQEARSNNGAGAALIQQMTSSDVLYCAELGKMRFDTKLVRNLTWFAQLQRVMRVVLINHLSWLNTPVVRGLKIADPKITEFNANEGFDNRDFTGESYETV